MTPTQSPWEGLQVVSFANSVHIVFVIGKFTVIFCGRGGMLGEGFYEKNLPWEGNFCGVVSFANFVHTVFFIEKFTVIFLWEGGMPGEDFYEKDLPLEGNFCGVNIPGKYYTGGR